MGLFSGFVLVETTWPLSDSCPSRQTGILPANCTLALRASSFNSLGESVKIKKATRWLAFFILVETAGIEPASVGTLPTDLHA